MISLSDNNLRVPEFAYYYGDWIWNEELTAWVKSLLLFFDGIALSVSPARADELIESNPVLAQPLAEVGLLRNYWPDSVEDWLKPYMPEAEKYAPWVLRVIEIYKHIPEGGTLSASDRQELERVITEGGDALQAGLEAHFDVYSRAAQKYGGTPSQIQATPVGWMARLLRENITEVAIEPVIDDEGAAGFVAAMIGSHDDGHANIVIGDMAQVGIDLGAVPLDEVLDFRAKHGAEYRRYANDVRRFVLELSLTDDASRGSATFERRADLDDRAAQLRKIGRTAFSRQTIGFSFGLAGAAWTLVHGDPWGASFAAGAAAAGLSKQDPESIGASYTYILRAKTELEH
jgi:hypothetical protein